MSPLDRLNRARVTRSGPVVVNSGDVFTLDIQVMTDKHPQSDLGMLYQNNLHVATLELDDMGNSTYTTSIASSGPCFFVASYSGHAHYQPKGSEILEIKRP